LLVGLLGWALIFLTLLPSHQPLMAALQTLVAPDAFSEEDDVTDEEENHGKWSSSTHVLRRGVRRRVSPEQLLCMDPNPLPRPKGSRPTSGRLANILPFLAFPFEGSGANMRC
jgi:hypothetical protein